MYQGKSMLITGAYQGIGKAIATYFAHLGVNLILTYHENKDATRKLEQELKEKYHVEVHSYYLDLIDEKSIKALFKQVKNDYGRIDFLVNNAALSLDNNIENKTKDEFMKVLEVNVIGTFLMMQYFDSIVHGYIFNLASTDGIDTGNIYSIDYNASKAGIISLTKTFALYSHNKIICLCPNWVDTESTRGMDKCYLQREMQRIKQEALIKVDTIPKVMDEFITKRLATGSIIRIEGENNYGRID